MTNTISLLSSRHDRKQFACGKPMLDAYIHKQARQDVEKRVATCFILSGDDKTIKGYYTLSSGSIPRSLIPEDIIQQLNLPRYGDMPVVLLGRLAVDGKFRGKGLGGDLIIDALKRSFASSSSSIAAMAVVVDPLDDEAERFYSKYGFIKLPDSGRMFLPMKTIEQLLSLAP